MKEGVVMDRNRVDTTNQATEQMTEAIREYYQAITDNAVALQERNVQLFQSFFETWNETLRRQAEANRQMGQQLADQQQRAAEAGQSLTRESVDAYMDFVNSMFSYWQESTEAAQRGTTEAQRTAAEAPAERQAGAELPLENYDSLTVEQMSERLDDLSVEEIRQLRAYEAENKSRSTLLWRLDERIEADSPA
jgi:hypothetical protein